MGEFNSMKGIEDKAIEKKTKISQAYFNPVMLAFYDFFVYRFVSRFVWGLPIEKLKENYHKHMRNNHLEVGVGTGYLLDQLDLSRTTLTLLDLSESCLKRSSNRLQRFRPECHQKNILKPIKLGKTYGSIGINYVMHCVVGDYKFKGLAFKHLKTVLDDDGVVFGVTVLDNAKASVMAKLTMFVLNAMGVFNNALDDADGLREALAKQFKYVSVEVDDSVAVFSASDALLPAT